MSTATRVWLLLATLYAFFFGWYTSFSGPLSEDEIAHYTEVVSSMGSSPEAVERWVEFMENDTGDDFAMINVIDLRDQPLPGPGIEPDDTSEAVMNRYSRPFLGQAALSAAHPVMIGTAAAPPLDLWGIEGAEEWDVGGLVRYRSRRDVLKQAEHIRSLDQNIHDFKIAALEKTIAYPLDPWFQLGDPRLVLALVFAVVGLGAQLLLTRKESGLP